MDLDATIIESWKPDAKETINGCGYQPQLALWAEMNVVSPWPMSSGTATCPRSSGGSLLLTNPNGHVS